MSRLRRSGLYPLCALPLAVAFGSSACAASGAPSAEDEKMATCFPKADRSLAHYARRIERLGLSGDVQTFFRQMHALGFDAERDLRKLDAEQRRRNQWMLQECHRFWNVPDSENRTMLIGVRRKWDEHLSFVSQLLGDQYSGQRLTVFDFPVELRAMCQSSMRCLRHMAVLLDLDRIFAFMEGTRAFMPKIAPPRLRPRTRAAAERTSRVDATADAVPVGDEQASDEAPAKPEAFAPNCAPPQTTFSLWATLDNGFKRAATFAKHVGFTSKVLSVMVSNAAGGNEQTK